VIVKGSSWFQPATISANNSFFLSIYGNDLFRSFSCYKLPLYQQITHSLFQFRVNDLFRSVLLSCAFFFALAVHAYAALVTPADLNLSAGMDSITVTWTGHSDDDGYYVYWGTSPSDISNKSNKIGKGVYPYDITYTITGLDRNTTYYVQVTAENNGQESERTNYKFITTQADTAAPAVPTGLAVSGDIGADSVTLTWDANTEDDLSKYIVHYGTDASDLTSTIEIDASDSHTANITGLDSSTRYYFAISARDTSGNESDISDELIVDTTPDTLSPYVPAGIDAKVSGIGEITVSVSPGNSHMADFAGINLYYGSASGDYDTKVDLGTDTSYTLTDLEQGSTWYFAAAAYDSSGNESEKSSEASVTVEPVTNFIARDSGFDGGCFIQTAASGKKKKRVKKNRTGVSFGYLWSAEKSFKSFYGKDRYPVFVFLDRVIFHHVSAGISAGFMRRTGKLRTVSGSSTHISSTLTLVPMAASLDYDFRIIPHVEGFIGAGPDFWYVDEDPGTNAFDLGTREWVGGYHGHAGVRLYNTDPDYADWGVRIEGNYSKIDRFGGNDIDIGGWILDVGFFYRF